MTFKALARLLKPNSVIEDRKSMNVTEDISRFTFTYENSSDIKRDVQEKYGHHSELLEIFTSSEDALVHKWHHYIPLYDRYFSPFRGRAIRFLEIGVGEGGSLEMWRRYFGDDAILFGIDVAPACKQFNGRAGQVRIGSQADGDFLESVVREMGGVDIVLDDGSHRMEHISASLQKLFPHVHHGGLYMIEDLHTAYWKGWGGGYRAKGNFFGFLMDLVDDMHHWYHGNALKQAAISSECSGIHIHDSLVVLEKNKVFKPVHSRIGRGVRRPSPECPPKQ